MEPVRITLYRRNSYRAYAIHEFSTQLEADLFVHPGGRKERLVARAWVALQAEGLFADTTYEQFRADFRKKTYQKLHELFDPLLPEEHRAKK